MSDFVKVAKKAEISDGTGKTVDVNGKAVAVFNAGGNFYALDNACAHRGGPLGEGDVSGAQVTCPWHGWQFDVKTGSAVHTAASVKCFEVKVEGDDVLVGS